MFFAISKKDVDCEVMWRKISFYALIKHGFLTYESERAQVPFARSFILLFLGLEKHMRIFFPISAQPLTCNVIF